MSQKGLALLMEWEGPRSKVYDDDGDGNPATGHPTIGVGHKLLPQEVQAGAVFIGGQMVPYQNGLTVPQEQALLQQDLASTEAAVNTHVARALTQDQYDALVCLAFNVGVNAFCRSTLLRLINAGRLDLVPAEFMRWVFSGGQKVQGLINRRTNEVALWEGRL
jgi:lysozyme